jgi:uncharacterized protein (TIGR02284 family)
MAATQTDSLNSLLRGEISATETYNQALEKFAGQPAEAELRRLRDEHREAANSLRQHVHLHGGDPSTGSGAWGTWAKLVEGTAKLFGVTAALKALKEGEEHGVKSYQAALRDDDLTADCKGLISAQLLPRTQAHIPVLDQLMSAKPRS